MELVTVFSMKNAHIYRGFSFSVTLRSAVIVVTDPDTGALVPMVIHGTMEQAHDHMDTLIADHEQTGSLANFIVQDPNDQRPPQEAAQRPQSQQGQATQQNTYGGGNEGDMGVDTILETQKLADQKTGEPYIGLFAKFGQGVSKFPVYKLYFSKEEHQAHIAEVNQITRTDWSLCQMAYKIGTQYSAEYELGKQKSVDKPDRWHNLRRLFVPSSASNNVPF